MILITKSPKFQELFITTSNELPTEMITRGVIEKEHHTHFVDTFQNL